MINIFRNAFLAVVVMFSMIGGTLLASPTASAQGCDTGGILSFPRWYDGLCQNGKIESPADKGLPTFVWTIVLNLVDMLLYAVGYVSLAFVIWGGFKFMISGDNAAGSAAARKTILNAIIGLVLSIMSVGIVNVVAGAIK